MKIDESFRDALSGLDIEKLDESPHVIYACDKNLRIRFFNKAYENFAKDNGGEEILESCDIGTDLSKVYLEPYKSYYLDSYKNVLDQEVTFEQDYECSSVDTFRKFHLTAQPLNSGQGILFYNSLSVSIPHVYEDHSHHHNSHFLPYIDSKGAISQCISCRKVKNFDIENRWDWIPQFIEKPHPHIVHLFCPVCKQQYYTDENSNKLHS